MSELNTESFLKQPIKEENAIFLNWKFSRNAGARKSRFIMVNSIARKMQRKEPKENFIIYLKGMNISLFYIYDIEKCSFIRISLANESKISKRRYWRKSKRTTKKPKKKNY